MVREAGGARSKDAARRGERDEGSSGEEEDEGRSLWRSPGRETRPNKTRPRFNAVSNLRPHGEALQQGKPCSEPSGKLSSESTSQILYVLEGGFRYLSTKYEIRNNVTMGESNSKQTLLDIR